MLTPIHRGGVLITGHNLWLDPKRKKPFAVISHAHADHVARHKSYLATPATIDLIRVRVGDALADRGTALPFGESYERRDYRIRLYPAGHVLGSAMVHVETDAGDTLLYTGDFKMRPGVSSEPIEIPHADVVVMETTFGRPNYVFPSADQVKEQLYEFCDKTLASGQTPVLMAYSLGKAQEVLKLLEGYGKTLMAEKVIRQVNQVYGYHGCPIPDARQLDFLNMDGCVIVLPPTMRKRLPKTGVRTAMVTGWGMDEAARYRYGVDEIIPLSDHADYPGLLDFVDHVSPNVVYTMHGYDQDFATDLRRRGHEAWTLAGSDQLELL